MEPTKKWPPSLSSSSLTQWSHHHHCNEGGIKTVPFCQILQTKRWAISPPPPLHPPSSLLQANWFRCLNGSDELGRGEVFSKLPLGTGLAMQILPSDTAVIGPCPAPLQTRDLEHNFTPQPTSKDVTNKEWAICMSLLFLSGPSMGRIWTLITRKIFHIFRTGTSWGALFDLWKA